MIAKAKGIPSWPALLAAVVVVAMASGLSILLLRHESERARLSELHLSRIHELASRLGAIEWEIEARPEQAQHLAQEAQQIDAQLQRQLEELTALHPSYQSDRVWGGLNNYMGQVQRLNQLRGSAQFLAANDLAREAVNPAYDVLMDAVAATSAVYQQAAQRAATTADLGSGATLLAMAVLLVALFWRFEQARRANGRMVQSLIQNASDLISVLEADGTMRYHSPAIERLLGYPPAAVVGRNWLAYLHPDDQGQARRMIAQAARQPCANVAAELRFRHADGSWRHFDLVVTNRLADPTIAGIIATCRDVTERKAFEQRLLDLAYCDPLTGLPNRLLFMERLTRALQEAAEGNNGSVAVLFLDLDNFKVINDSLGHQTGDQLLVAVSQRVRSGVAPAGTVARLGGDEFTILLVQAGLAEAAQAAERIAELLRPPFNLGGREVFVTPSIGIAVAPDRGDQPEALLSEADLALYHAKIGGKARYAVFDSSMQAAMLERLELEHDLRQAVDRGELYLHYQPIVNLETLAISELEALVRWQHPRHGLIAPGRFIPLAEETGLILPLGYWVMGEACRQLRRWQDQYPWHHHLVMAVNLSVRQLQDPHLFENIIRILDETSLSPANLMLEVTESVMLKDVTTTIATLQQLKALGVRLAMDDFGTGYSSLAYLKKLPLDVLKIDHCFVNKLGKDPTDEAIVGAVVRLGETLDLEVVGEGIETAGQLAALQALGCDRGQGYYFARPQSTVEIGAMLAGALQAPGTGSAGDLHLQ